MLNSSGIGAYLQNIINGLEQEGEKITLLGDVTQLKRFEFFANIVSFTSPIYSIQEQINYLKIIPECDIFWSPHYNIPLSSSIKSKTRLVTIHDVYHLAFYRQLSFKQKLYAKFVINQAVKLSDKIITVSNFSKQEIIKYTGCNQNKIEVIYNGINLHSSQILTNDIKVKYRLPNKYILFVGNIKPHKNLSTLLKAYKMLGEAMQLKYKLVLAGKRDGFITGDTTLLSFINDNPTLKDNVIFTGYVDEEDMNDLYKQASVFVFPSIYEGFGLPPLEAMVNDCPVIASSSGSLREICGEAAEYFHYDDENAICQSIIDILNNDSKRSKLIDNGRERTKMFPWSSSIKSHKYVFDSLQHK